MREVTEKQLAYIDFLIDRAEEEGVLEEVIHDINPDLRENEEFCDWIKFQSVRRASEVIDTLKTYLDS